MLKKIEKFNIFIVYVKKWSNIIYQEEKGFIRNENNDIEEAKVKSSWKGYSFDVINKLTEEQRAHKSETELDLYNFDFVIRNNTTLDEAYNKRLLNLQCKIILDRIEVYYSESI